MVLATDRSSTKPPETHILDQIFEHFRCPEAFHNVVTSGRRAGPSGYFRFGPGAVGYGCTTTPNSSRIDGSLADLLAEARIGNGSIDLPFDPGEVVDNLRLERYADRGSESRWIERSWVYSLYYRLRPRIPAAVRERLQRIYFRGWERLNFPT